MYTVEPKLHHFIYLYSYLYMVETPNFTVNIDFYSAFSLK